MTNEIPSYLLLPLAASVLFALGMIFVKKASHSGSGPWTVTFVTNLWAALLFSALWPLGGATEPWQRMWQPGVVALMYLFGQICTFLAVQLGDVSVAVPIFSVKVTMVAVFLTLVAGQTLSLPVWLAALAATVGVALVGRSRSASSRGSLALSVVFALLAAGNFALFDVMVQRWAPAWGVGRFLPLVFGIAGILSLGFLPWVDFRSLRIAVRRRPLLLGAFLIALQSLFIVMTIAFFGDAARVNIVYALRGIWGVLLAWLFARWLGGGEMHQPRQIMISRLAGATLLTLAVIAAIVAKPA